MISGRIMVPHEEGTWVAGGGQWEGNGVFSVHVLLCHMNFEPRVYIMWLLKYRRVFKNKIIKNVHIAKQERWSVFRVALLPFLILPPLHPRVPGPPVTVSHSSPQISTVSLYIKDQQAEVQRR